MSRVDPRFGEVFRYINGGAKVMYIGPMPDGDTLGEWMGITLDPGTTALATLGDVAWRVPLDDIFQDWSEVPDESD